jgi:hypothetical protein
VTISGCVVVTLDEAGVTVTVGDVSAVTLTLPVPVAPE